MNKPKQDVQLVQQVQQEKLLPQPNPEAGLNPEIEKAAIQDVDAIQTELALRNRLGFKISEITWVLDDDQSKGIAIKVKGMMKDLTRYTFDDNQKVIRVERVPAGGHNSWG